MTHIAFEIWSSQREKHWRQGIFIIVRFFQESLIYVRGKISVFSYAFFIMVNLCSQDTYRNENRYGLSARVLKECSSEISPMLALIYNESLAQGTLPDDWRQANVAPVFKKGEKYNAAD